MEAAALRGWFRTEGGFGNDIGALPSDEEFTSSKLGFEWDVRSRLEQLGNVGTELGRLGGGSVFQEEFRLAGLVLGGSFVERLDLGGLAGQDLEEHGLIAKLSGGHVDKVGSVDKASPKFFRIERGVGIAAGNEDVVNVCHIGGA